MRVFLGVEASGCTTIEVTDRRTANP